MAAQGQRYYANLVGTGTNAAMANQMFDFGGLNDVVGTDEMLALGKTYDGEQSMSLDPVTLAILKGRLEQIADEMDATLFRSAFNPIIAEAHDASHGIYDAENWRYAGPG